MTVPLYVAAGGGGDAIVSVLVDACLEPAGGRPAVLSYAWDRLLVDPVPGPRGAEWFRGLEAVGERNHRILAETEPVPPAGSTLPRLAAELDADLYLLDPTRGASDLGGQMDELVNIVGADVLRLVDVGGDILARGDEAGLRSPLADSLSLAAAAGLDVPVDVLMCGPGLDGELAEAYVLERSAALGAEESAFRLQPTGPDLDSLFRWHPSETTGLLWAAASGTRGTAEIRDRGLPVQLTERSTRVWRFRHSDVLEANRIASDLRGTRSLDEVEEELRRYPCGSEIDYERQKAASRPASAPWDESGARERLNALLGEALGRGTDYLTTRRIAESLDISFSDLDALQSMLTSIGSDCYRPPLLDVRCALPLSP